MTPLIIKIVVLGPQLFFKGNILQNYFIGKYFILSLKNKSWGILYFIFGFSCAIDPAETNFDDFRSDYFGEYEAICETALARESGTPGWVN
jgi:hypothetical protein